MTHQVADKIERWPLERLAPYAKNAKLHTDAQVRRLAASMTEFGWTFPVLVDEAGVLIAGHGRLAAARLLGLQEAPVMVAAGWSDAKVRAYRLADNRLAEDAAWDDELLREEFAELTALDFDLQLTGFTEFEIDKLMGTGASSRGNPDQAPPPPDPARVVSRQGDIWILGRHRIACGDCRDPALLVELMNGEIARVIHADPPYGLGKQAQGVQNDNLQGDALDAFQHQWWLACRPHLVGAGSAFIWGQPEDLWRWWHRDGGLKSTEPMVACNELVWTKGGTAETRGERRRSFTSITERCLYVQLGKHVLQNNRTQDDYWEGWEPLRSWLVAERDKAGFRSRDVKKICGNDMAGHWFSRSQWCFLSRENYELLATAAAGKAFTRSFADLEGEYKRLQMAFKGQVLGRKRADFDAARPYFDASWDVLTDLWDFPRVSGEERFGHATPKPSQMAERAIKCTSQEDEIVLEPFAGTGSTLIGAERCSRRCFTLELDPVYVDLVVRRWQSMTGNTATLESSGQAFDEVVSART